MPNTTIADLWVPEIWREGLMEKSKTRTSLINAGIAVRSPLFDELASGGGEKVNIPFLQEPVHDDEIQKEGEGPKINSLTSGTQVAPILNRVSSAGTGALAAAVAATDPVGAILDTMADLRLRQRQNTLVSVLQGTYGTDDTAALAALREDHFTEEASSPDAKNLFSPEMMMEGLNRLGELKAELADGKGIFVCHPDVELALSKEDLIETVRNSEGQLVLKAFKGLTIYMSNLLRRDGTKSGYVYTSFVLSKNMVALGEKDQSAHVGDVASLVLKEDAHTNEVTVYDRSRFVMHVNGVSWKGKPAGQSATNAELATPGNWELAYRDVENLRAVCFRTNG